MTTCRPQLVWLSNYFTAVVVPTFVLLCDVQLGSRDPSRSSRCACSAAAVSARADRRRLCEHGCSRCCAPAVRAADEHPRRQQHPRCSCWHAGQRRHEPRLPQLLRVVFTGLCRMTKQRACVLLAPGTRVRAGRQLPALQIPARTCRTRCSLATRQSRACFWTSVTVSRCWHRLRA